MGGMYGKKTEADCFRRRNLTGYSLEVRDN